MNTVLIILCVVLEALYIFNCIKTIKTHKIKSSKNIFLFIGILFVNLFSGVLSGILALSAFKYIIIIALDCVLLNLTYHKLFRFYDIFFISIFWLFKFFVEYLYCKFLSCTLDYNQILFCTLINLLIVLLSVMFKQLILKLYNKTILIFNNNTAFYLRYILFTLLNISILIYIGILELKMVVNYI